MILGEVVSKEYREKYTKENTKSKHLDIRKDRLAIVIEDAKPLFYYEVLKEEERQVHVLYEDATLFVFNKETGLIITIIILSRKRMAMYFRAAHDYSSEHPYTQRCAKLHELHIKRHYELNKTEIKNLRDMKMKHLRMIKR